MRFTSILAAAAALVLSSSDLASAGTFNSKDVLQLGHRDFNAFVKSTSKLSIVAWYAPWCGYCKQLAPEFDKAATSLRNLVNFISVDCDQEANKPLCAAEGIQGFPTLKLFSGGNAPSRPYEGPREVKGIIDAVVAEMPNFVKRAMTVKDLEALKTATKPVSLLFTSSGKVSPLYKALSSDLRKTIDFYAARDTKVGAEGLAVYGVEKTPTLLLIQGDKINKYEGPLKYDNIAGFLKKHTGRGKDEL